MSIKAKVKSALRTIIQMTKEEKIQPIIVPTDREKLLEGKVALITGGSSGIGQAIASAFVQSGAKVILASTNIDKLNLASQKIGGVVTQ